LYTILRTIYRPRKSPICSDVSRPTINQLLFKPRTRIAQLCDASSPFSGEVEVNESYFGGHRIRGKKGRAGPRVKRLSSGFWNATEIIPNAAKKPLQAAILPTIDYVTI